MPDDSSSGALSPLDATHSLHQVGLHHLFEPAQLTFLKNLYGGILFSLCGLFSLIAAAGSPGLAESNPGLVRLLQGATFPVGLVIVYGVGAELFIAYPMWFATAALDRKGSPVLYVRALIFSWVGNLIGAMFSAAVFSYATQSLHEEPYRSGVIEQVTTDITEAQWHVIRSPVTLAMFFGSQNQDRISKALGLHLPFFLSTTARFPHTVEYMYLASIGMMLGAPLSIWGYVWKCLLPITIGNTIGGALFVGVYNWWVYLRCQDGKKQTDGFVSLDGAPDG